MQYRREVGRHTWHFHRNCPDWPSEFNLIISAEPWADGELCKQCVALEQRGERKEDQPALHA